MPCLVCGYLYSNIHLKVERSGSGVSLEGRLTEDTFEDSFWKAPVSFYKESSGLAFELSRWVLQGSQEDIGSQNILVLITDLENVFNQYDQSSLDDSIYTTAAPFSEVANMSLLEQRHERPFTTHWVASERI